jgi:hypothetical protein
MTTDTDRACHSLSNTLTPFALSVTDTTLIDSTLCCSSFSAFTFVIALATYS